MLKFAFTVVLIITLITLLGAFFATPELTNICSERLISCFEKVQYLPLAERLWSVLKCVFSNVICVFEQIVGIFR
ncbi:MAG: hypothetical protein IKZ02_02835 [Alphaproteobacteria bacterium]|nr:hypothetical protein [Alphaproteobacteria bacterium]